MKGVYIMKKKINWHRGIQSTSAIILALCTLAIAGITAFYTYYASQQVCETRKAVKIAENSNKIGADSMKNTLAEMKRQSTATKIAADAAQKSAGIAEKTMIGTQRPWVSVHLNLGSGFKFDKEGGTITIVFRVKNVGNSPAMGVNIHPGVVLSFIPKDVIDEQKRMLATIPRNDPTPDLPPHFGYILFPGEEFTYETTFPISREQIEKFKTEMIKSFGGNRESLKFITPSVVGCVVYRFSFDKSVHKTGFIAQIFQINPLYPNASYLIDSEAGDVPLNLLKLQISEFGSYAD